MTTPTLHVGDRVAFSRQFLRSTAQYTGPVPFLRGTVTGLEDISHGWTLAAIRWDHGAPGPSRVNTRNLVRADRLHLEPV